MLLLLIEEAIKRAGRGSKYLDLDTIGTQINTFRTKGKLTAKQKTDFTALIAAKKAEQQARSGK